MFLTETIKELTAICIINLSFIKLMQCQEGFIKHRLWAALESTCESMFVIGHMD